MLLLLNLKVAIVPIYFNIFEMYSILGWYANFQYSSRTSHITITITKFEGILISVYFLFRELKSSSQGRILQNLSQDVQTALQCEEIQIGILQ